MFRKALSRLLHFKIFRRPETNLGKGGVGAYQPPVDRLLALGEPGKKDWLDYQTMGLSEAHIPELARLAADRELNFEADQDGPEVWAPMHAWRALGQLRAVSAVGPLLELLDEADDNDDEWAMEEIPIVLGMIGPEALEPISRYLDHRHNLFGHVAAISAVEEIAKRHLESRGRCIKLLNRKLERYKKQDPALNAFIVMYLCDLKAVEAMPLIERAYHDDCVDETIQGDLEDVKVRMELIPPIPEREREREEARIEIENAMFPQRLAVAGERRAKKKTRSKANAARKARRKNRR
ncbi:DUF1186 domain-containing protein [candidate division TA06 bacterium]|uniref:DUF1186 domain-containing protein n=1 Tax=candidate division TA06 bacterium TaxID=2250710 RepID=A0A933IB90_UNCT6|nr:DUF1186 domain-containing protein [candidate division TA06 bacterium]